MKAGNFSQTLKPKKCICIILLFLLSAGTLCMWPLMPAVLWFYFYVDNGLVRMWGHWHYLPEVSDLLFILDVSVINMEISGCELHKIY